MSKPLCVCPLAYSLTGRVLILNINNNRHLIISINEFYSRLTCLWASRSGNADPGVWKHWTSNCWSLRCGWLPQFMAWAHQHQKLAVLWLSPILPEVNEHLPRKIQHLQLSTVATEYKYAKLLMVQLDSCPKQSQKGEGMANSADCWRKGTDELLCRLSQFFQVQIQKWAFGWNSRITSRWHPGLDYNFPVSLSLPGTDIPVSFVASALARVHLNRKSWGCNHFQCRKELALEPEESNSGRRRTDSLAWDQGPKVPLRFPWG